MARGHTAEGLQLHKPIIPQCGRETKIKIEIEGRLRGRRDKTPRRLGDGTIAMQEMLRGANHGGHSVRGLDAVLPAVEGTAAGVSV